MDAASGRPSATRAIIVSKIMARRRQYCQLWLSTFIKLCELPKLCIFLLSPDEVGGTRLEVHWRNSSERKLNTSKCKFILYAQYIITITANNFRNSLRPHSLFIFTGWIFYLRDELRTWTHKLQQSAQTAGRRTNCSSHTDALSKRGLQLQSVCLGPPSGVNPTWNTTSGSSHNHGQTSKVIPPNPVHFIVYCFVRGNAISFYNVM